MHNHLCSSIRLSAGRKKIKIAAGDLDLSCLRLAGVGGDMIDIDQLQEFQNAASFHGFDANAFTPSYGLARIYSSGCFQKRTDCRKTESP